MSDVPTTPAPKAFNADAFALNLARAMENGGKALAAFLQPRENGEINRMGPGEMGEVIKTLTQVIEYWMSDQTRASELQMKLGASYLDFWARSVRRLNGEEAEPTIEPNPRDKRFQDPDW